LTIRPEFVRSFIGGYEQVRPLSADEIAALPIMLSEGFPPHAHNYRYWRDSRGEDINARFMLEVAIMKALEDQLPQICESLGQTTSRGQRSIFDDASRSR
jgi:Ser/Thr protein kinase RdoA (MazF antagonist)